MSKDRYLYFVSNSLSKKKYFRSIVDIVFFKKNILVNKFRQQVANFFLVKQDHVYLFGAARMGLYSILKVLKLSSKDEVIVAGYTCVVVTNAVKFANCTLKYVDIHNDTLNIDTKKLIEQINENTKVIIIPHNFGLVYDQIDEIKIKFPHLFIIEDAAHTFGSYNFETKEKCGLMGDASFFSMEYSKPITTGLGGIIIIKNEKFNHLFHTYYKDLPYFNNKNVFKIFITLSIYCLSSSKKANYFATKIFNAFYKLDLIYRTSQSEIDGVIPKNYPVKLSPFLSVFGYYQMLNINEINDEKNNISKKYYEAFKEFKNLKTFYSPNVVFVRFPIVFSDEIKIDKINQIKQIASQKGYSFGVWFDDVVHPRGSFAYCYESGSCPKGEYISERIINLPININVSLTDIEIDAIKTIFHEHGII